MATATEVLTRSFEIDLDDVSPKRRTVTARINTGCVDRYRTVICPEGGDWTNFMRSGPAVLWEHGNDPTRGRAPVAHCSSIKYRRVDDDLLAVMQFKSDPFSSDLLDHYATGTLRSFSVEFLPDGAESSRPTQEEVRKKPIWGKAHTIYRKWEMTGVSAVSYPGNPEALALAVERGLWVPEETRRALAAIPAEDQGEDEDDGDDYDRSRIKKVGDEWGVYSDEGELIAKHKTKAEAVQQLQAIYVQKDKESNKKSAPASVSIFRPRGMGEGTGSQGGYTTKVKSADQDTDPSDDDDDDDEEEDEDEEDRYIKHEGSQWVVYSEAGEVLGKHDSKADAVAQLQAIEANKHKKDAPPDPSRAYAELYDQYKAIEARLAAVEGRPAVKVEETAIGPDDGLDRHLGRQGDFWVVYAEDGSVLGEHSTKEEAVAQLRSIEEAAAKPATPYDALPRIRTFTLDELSSAIVDSVLPITQSIISYQVAAFERALRDRDDLARGRV